MSGYTDHNSKIELLKNGTLSLKDNVRFFIDKIKKYSHLNCYTFVAEENALRNAFVIEQKIKKGNHGKLAGMVIAVKDIITVKDIPLSCCSAILGEYVPSYNADVIERLIAEDAIIIGKTNCDEFAMGSSNEYSIHGPVLNPYDNSRVAGGSSGGSACAVAAGLCDASLGSDTGGSVRQPAAFCGIYGLRPEYGSVSRRGLTSFASSLDTIGPMATNYNDILKILNVIGKKDTYDSTSRKSVLKGEKKIGSVGFPKELKPLLHQEFFNKSVGKFLRLLEDAGINVKFPSIPLLEFSNEVYYVIANAEAASNLSRFDKIRYGKTSGGTHSSDSLDKIRTSLFGQEVKRRIMSGNFILSSGYSEKYFEKAAKIRRLITKSVLEALDICDILITPTTPGAAFSLEQKRENPVSMYNADIYTTPASLAGLAALHIPLEMGKNSGLPFGIQIICRNSDLRNLTGIIEIYNQGKDQ